MWETINAVPNIKVNPSIGVDVVHEAVLVDEFCWDVAQFDVDVLRSVQGCLRVNLFMSRVTNLAPLRERTLLMSSLMRCREAVLVPM